MTPPNGPTDKSASSANTPHRRALAALAAEYRVPAFDLEVAHFSLEPLELIDRSYCEEHTCLPVQVSGGLLFLAMADPTQEELLDELSTRTGRRVFAFVCAPEALRRAIDEAYGGLIIGKTHYSGPRATQGATSAMTSNAVIAPPISFGPPPKPRSTAAASTLSAEPPPPPPPESKSALLRFDELLTEDDLEEYTEPAIDPHALASAVAAADATRAPDAPRPATLSIASRVDPLGSTVLIGSAFDEGPTNPGAPPVAREEPPPREEPSMGEYLRTLTESSRSDDESAEAAEAPRDDAAPTDRAPVEAETLRARMRKTPPTPPPFTTRAPTKEPEKSPANEPVPAATVAATGAPAAASATTLRGQGRTVLVADDDASARLTVRDVLEPLGFRVVEADSGPATLALVEAAAIDLLVIEGALPGIHGFEVCRRVTKSPLHWHVPVLIVSRAHRGWRFAADARASFGAGACLGKPLRHDEVLATVDRLLNSSERAERTAAETLTPATERVLAAAMQSTRAGDLEAASAELERGIEREPDAFRLHYTYALIAGRRGDALRAIRSLESALELQPRSFVAMKNLAVLYEREGFRRTSIDLWERAREHAPDEGTRAELEGHLMALLLSGPA